MTKMKDHPVYAAVRRRLIDAVESDHDLTRTEARMCVDDWLAAIADTEVPIDAAPVWPYTITRDDIGKASIRIAGRNWPMSDVLGRVLSHDVGKQIFAVTTRSGDTILQVENNEQFVTRMRREKLKAHKS